MGNPRRVAFVRTPVTEASDLTPRRTDSRNREVKSLSTAPRRKSRKQLEAMSVKQLVNYLTDRLEREGVRVEVYNAVTTSSVYLTFDNGLLKKGRVADHKGKGYSYTYEVGSHIPARQTVPKKHKDRVFERHLFPVVDIESLIEMVLQRRTEIQEKYGLKWYTAKLNESRTEEGS